jgi:hypothetical protein
MLERARCQLNYELFRKHLRVGQLILAFLPLS